MEKSRPRGGSGRRRRAGNSAASRRVPRRAGDDAPAGFLEKAVELIEAQAVERFAGQLENLVLGLGGLTLSLADPRPFRRRERRILAVDGERCGSTPRARQAAAKPLRGWPKCQRALRAPLRSTNSVHWSKLSSVLERGEQHGVVGHPEVHLLVGARGVDRRGAGIELRPAPARGAERLVVVRPGMKWAVSPRKSSADRSAL